MRASSSQPRLISAPAFVWPLAILTVADLPCCVCIPNCACTAGKLIMTTGSLRLRTMIDGTLVSATNHPSGHLFFNASTCARVRVPTMPSPPSLPHSCSCVCFWVFRFHSLHLSPMPQNPLTHSYVLTGLLLLIILSVFHLSFFLFSIITTCPANYFLGTPDSMVVYATWAAGICHGGAEASRTWKQLVNRTSTKQRC